ncbi:MAG: TetR/AcrR family transcriptional regulator [Acidimicrobiia bacterium]|nr:TetR/AcrR family transcriptional regulator [Acidimicrobiia bacterium]
MPRRYSMENRAAATAATRQRVIEAALDEVVMADGEPITLQGVADRADLSLRTLYNHFPNRESLLSAAFSYHAAQSRAAVEAVTLPDADPEEQLRHLIEAYYSRYEQMGARLGALLSLRGFPELDKQIRTIRTWRRQVVREVVGRAEAAGVLDIPEPIAVALAFTMTSHATWQQLVGELDGSPRAAPDVAWQALRSALFGGHRQPGREGVVGKGPKATSEPMRTSRVQPGGRGARAG